MFKKNRFIALAAVVVVLVAGLVFRHGQFAPVNLSHAITPENQVPMQFAQPGRALPDFTALVEQAGPAVVNISTVQKVRTSAEDSGLDPQDPFFEFFHQFRMPAPHLVPQQGVGSGFIISPDGRILTNAHVVADANEVTVKLTDKREFKAKVIGVDRRTDVALIKINASALPTVRIGDSSAVKVGAWVAAIGSPFGFENSVTAGIISAKSRSLPDENYVPFLQTDVAINPGNSGGPLFNMDGEVIGINSQIYSRTGGYMGLSFAIPIEVAMKISGDLQQYGKVRHGQIGVTVQPLNQELADSFGLKDKQGALVSSVQSNSPAAKAGVVPGDVILAVNDRAIEQPADLARMISDTKPGEAITLNIWRNGRSQKLRATVGESAPEKIAAAESSAHESSGKLGLVVRPLTGDERKQLGTNGGVVVEEAAGVAARVGVESGDVILAINNEEVKSVEQLRRLVAKSHGNVALLVQRDTRRIYIPVKLG